MLFTTHLILTLLLASLVAQTVKCLPAMRETRVRPLGQKDPLVKEVATHSSTLAWKIPWTEESGIYSPWSRKEWDTTEQLHIVHVEENEISPLLPPFGHFIFLLCQFLIKESQQSYEDFAFPKESIWFLGLKDLLLFRMPDQW